MLINAGKQSSLSATAQATSVGAFVVVSGCFSIVLFLCLMHEDFFHVLKKKVKIQPHRRSPQRTGWDMKSYN